MVKLLLDSDQIDRLVRDFAEKNVVPVKAPPSAKHRYELRRNDKSGKDMQGPHAFGREETAAIIKCLGISDDRSCKAMREHIKSLRKSLGYK